MEWELNMEKHKPWQGLQRGDAQKPFENQWEINDFPKWNSSEHIGDRSGSRISKRHSRWSDAPKRAEDRCNACDGTLGAAWGRGGRTALAFDPL
jgi:hypothetical protein